MTKKPKLTGQVKRLYDFWVRIHKEFEGEGDALTEERLRERFEANHAEGRLQALRALSKRRKEAEEE